MKKKLVLMIPVICGLILSACSGAESKGGNGGGGGTPLPENCVETFNRARKNTIESIQYEYDFNLTAKIKFKNAVAFSPATYSGTTYVNTGNEKTQFLQKRTLSGLLVIDSTNYIYNIDNDLIKISADEDKDFSVINHEHVSSVYDYDKNNFGYILKSLDDNGLLKAEYKNGHYYLSLKTNFNQDSLLGMLNHIDSKLILKALSSYTTKEWGVGFTVNTWADLNDQRNQLKKFHFDASVVIKDTFEIGFEFEQTFTKYSGVSIVPPTFTNTLTVEDEVKAELQKVKNVFTTSKAASTSYYDYDVKTTVDHGVSKTNPLGLAVNSRTKGFTKRQLLGDKVYFNNRLLVDSDYKNSDQLGNLVADYDSYRARINDGNDTVYDVLDPKVGFNKYTELTGYNEDDVDDYYMLPNEELLTYENFKVIKKSTDSNNNTVYKFGMTNEAAKNVLIYYNKSFRIDFNRITVFDIYKIDSEFSTKKAYFNVVVSPENKLVAVDIDFKGFYIESDSNDQVKYRLEVTIDYDWTKSYTAVTNKEDIDNK